MQARSGSGAASARPCARRARWWARECLPGERRAPRRRGRLGGRGRDGHGCGGPAPALDLRGDRIRPGPGGGLEAADFSAVVLGRAALRAAGLEGGLAAGLRRNGRFNGRLGHHPRLRLLAPAATPRAPEACSRRAFRQTCQRSSRPCFHRLSLGRGPAGLVAHRSLLVSPSPRAGNAPARGEPRRGERRIRTSCACPSARPSRCPWRRRSRPRRLAHRLAGVGRRAGASGPASARTAPA